MAGAKDVLKSVADGVKQATNVKGLKSGIDRRTKDMVEKGLTRTVEGPQRYASNKNSLYSGVYQDELLPAGRIRASDKAATSRLDTMRNTMEMSLEKEGRSFWGAMGRDALQGGAVGGMTGGISSSMQGGDFWEGFKGGAFNGAVGWGGYRAGMRSVGATNKFNPFGKGGIVTEGRNMSKALSSDKGVSKQVVSLLNAQQQAGIAKTMLQGGYKIPTS